MTEEHDVDVGGERVGDRPGSLERCPAYERRTPLEHVLDALAVAGRHNPVAHGDVGTDVADPFGTAHTVAGEQRAPPAVDAAHAGGRPGRTERLPRRLKVVAPTQRLQRRCRHDGDGNPVSGRRR